MLLAHPLLLLLAQANAAEPAHLTVDEALTALELHNPSLARAHAQADAADAGKLLALSATLPTLSAAGGYTRNNKEVTLDLSALFDFLASVGQDVSNAPGVTTLQPLDSLSGSVSLRVPLVVPSSWASIDAAGHSARAATDSVEATRSSLRGSALQAFWAEAAAEELVAAQQSSIERARALQATAERALAAGTSARLPVLQAQTEVARREGDLLQATAALAKARAAVGALLGQDGPVAVDMPSPPPPVAVDADALVQAALSTRAEIAAADEQVRAARGQLLAARLAAAPSLSASGSAFASNQPYSTGDKTGWRATVDLNWTLLQGGLRAANDSRAQATLADAEAAADAAHLQVAQQVRSAVADLESATARVEVTGRQRALAEEAAKVAQRSYENGTIDARDVLDALDRLDLARTSEVDARARLGMADAALRAATGKW